MKFLCGSCRTKYQISDEKVRGKILTIRCKKCSAKIIVRESLVRAAGGGTAVAPLAEAPRSELETRAAAGGGMQPRVGGSTALASAYEGAMHRPSSDVGDMLTSIAPVPANIEFAGVEWYVAIDGEQHGPFAYADLVGKLRSGEVIGRHYVWHDGMEGWSRVRDVRDLANHLPPPKKKRPPPPPPPPVAVEPSEFNPLAATVLSPAAGADVVDLTKKRAEFEGRVQPPDSEAFAKETAHTDFVGAEQNKVRRSERVEELDQVLNQALGIEGEGSTEASPTGGAVAMAATAGVVSTTEPDAPVADGGSPPDDDLVSFEDKEDIFADVPRASDEDEHRESTRFFVAAAGVNRRISRNRLALVAGLALLSGLAVFFAAWATGFVEVEIPGIGNPFQTGSDTHVETEGGGEVDEDVDELKKQLAGDTKRRRSRGVRRRARRRDAANGDFVTDDPEESKLTSRGADDAPTYEVDAPGTGGGLGGANVGDAQLPESGVENMPPVEKRTLDEGAIARVVRARRKSVSICYEQSLRGQEDLRGKLEFAVTIQPSGRVSRVKVQTVAFRGSRLGRCIADKIKDWQFPPFSGPAQDVVVPFVLEKGSY